MTEPTSNENEKVLAPTGMAKWVVDRFGSKCWASTLGAALLGALAGAGAGAGVSKAVLGDDADSWKSWVIVVLGVVLGLLGGAAAGAALACWPEKRGSSETTEP
jgi:MFS family permease